MRKYIVYCGMNSLFNDICLLLYRFVFWTSHDVSRMIPEANVSERRVVLFTSPANFLCHRLIILTNATSNAIPGSF
jgi:hypothetical protein